MKYLLPYKVFESESQNKSDYNEEWEELSFEDKKSKLFSIYPAIPLEKRAAAVAIDKIRRAEGREISNIEDNRIDFPDRKPIDKLRWNQYFTSLMESKEIRGHNFEGLIAGLYGAKFTKPGERGDLEIESESGADKKIISVKSLNSKSESPVLGSVFDSLSEDQIKRINGRSIQQVYNQNKQDEEDLRESIWQSGFGGKNHVDYFLIAYFTEKTKKSSGTIFINIFSNKEMFDFVCSKGGLNAAKNKGQIYQFRVSSTYKDVKQSPIAIKIPEITEKDLNDIWNVTARNWGKYVFGKEISRKMRTDTIEDIIDNKGDISKRMSDS